MKIHDHTIFKDIILNKYGCPYCNVPTKHPCKTKSGALLQDYHKQRYDLATPQDRRSSIVYV